MQMSKKQLTEPVQSSLMILFTKPVLKSMSNFVRKSPVSLDIEWFACFSHAIDVFYILSEFYFMYEEDKKELEKFVRKTSRMLRNYRANFEQSEFGLPRVGYRRIEKHPLFISKVIVLIERSDGWRRQLGHRQFKSDLYPLD